MEARAEGIYGTPPGDLAEQPVGAIQFSPLMPGSGEPRGAADGSLAGMVMLAPPGTVERRYVIALALRALAPGARLTVLAPKDKGGSRLGKELKAFGCAVSRDARAPSPHLRRRSGPPDSEGVDEAIAAGAPRLDAGARPVVAARRVQLGPDRPGQRPAGAASAALAGRGADLGCGIGVLARAVLASPEVEHLTLVDIDRRAVEAARAQCRRPARPMLWADVRGRRRGSAGLDFVVMNPPFHDGGAEDQGARRRPSSAAPPRCCARAASAGSSPTGTCPTRPR